MVHRALWFKLLLICLMSKRTSAQDTCERTNCIVSEWNNWSDCSRTCGENGTRQRIKTVFRVASCGGTCEGHVEETEPCNIKCCPKDCEFSDWSKWGLCYCDDTGCEGGGARYNCHRTRQKLENKTCGGYCDEVTSQQQCGNLCCYQNCVVSSWSFWGICQGQCEQLGHMKRVRTIEQEPRCHGKQCGLLEEEKQCMGDCCPVDCVLGEWSAWSKCNVTCGESVETRTRFVRLPDCYGEECTEDPDDRQSRPCSQYTNVDCVVSPWSSWSDCILDNGYCGNGIKTRTRTAKTKPECKGQPCGNLTETGLCYGQCCIQDCIVSEWSVWSHCSTACGQGVSNRTRSITQSPSCGGSTCPDKLLDKRDCVVRDQLDCEFTDWSTWTACSTECGAGVQGRSRSLVTPAYCGGTCVNEATDEEVECESYEARQNCEVSEWSEWGDCVRNCASGDQTRNRTITVNPVCNGTACPAELVEQRECHEPCEQLCNLGVCSCNLGYYLLPDGVTCTGVVCPIPKVSYCPANHRELVDCRHPYFRCSDGYKYNMTCTPYCSPSDWTLKGTPLLVTCQNDRTWTQPEIFCARPNKPPVGIKVDTTVIEENKPKNYCFTYMSTITDNEQYEVHTYTIIEDVTNRFFIRGNRLCLTKKTDYEKGPSKWNVTLRSTDIEGEFVEQPIEFEITNANDPPSSVKVEPNEIPENSPPDTVVGCLSAHDDDVGQTVTMTLVDSFQHTFATFEDGDKICIKVVADSDPRCSTDGGTYCTLNMEDKDTHYITILAMDDGTPPMSAYYDIPVVLTNVNDRQTSIGIEPAFIPEEVKPGEPLVRLTTVDEDVDQTYTYILMDDNDGLFRVDGQNLTATRKFDFETESSEVFELMVESTDDDTETPLKVSKRLVMQIADVNEKPFDLQLSSVGGFFSFDLNQPQIKENIPAAIIGTVSVKDADAQDEVQITFVEGMDAEGRLTLFNTRCSSLSTVNVYCSATLVLVGGLNYETEDHVNISLSAKDKQGITTFLNITIEVLDANDPPTKILFDGKENECLEVKESQQNVKISELSVVDEDAEDDHTFDLIDSATGLFTIEKNILKTSKDSVVDYEVRKEHTIKLKCTDSGEPPLSTTFEVTVKVTDVNEEPTATVLSNNKVQENSPEDTVIGELTTTDPDNEAEERQSFRYSLPDDAKGRFKLKGDKLVVKDSSRICGNKPCALDFEQEPRLYVTVLTMDDGRPRLHRQDTFVILLENANDPPTDVKLTNNVVNENEPAGTVVGNAIATDQDGAESLSFELKNHRDEFGFQEGNKLVTKTVLNFEYLRSYRVRVSVTDDGDPPAESEETIVVQILNVNEAPEVTNVDEHIIVNDDAIPDSPAATIKISDPDSRDSITVTAYDPTGTFSMDEPICNTTPATGATDCTANLLANTILDVNVADEYQIELSVQDAKGLTSSYDVIVTVKDVNNAPSNILVNGIDNVTFHTPEDTEISSIAEFTSVDADVGQTFTYKVVADSSGLLSMSEHTLQSKSSLDFESDMTTISFTLEVQDSGSPALSLNKSFVLLVEDVNEPPKDLNLSKSQVEEDSGPGTVIGDFEVDDPDNNQAFTIILLDNFSDLFVVDNNTLKIGENACLENDKDSCVLNYEKQSQIILSVFVKDDGSPPKSAQFDITLTIIDVNEAPRDIQLNGNQVVIGSPSGTIVGILKAADDDVGQTYAFQLNDYTDHFDVDASNNLVVTDTSTLAEGEVLYITVTATDDGSPPASSTDVVPVIIKGAENVTIYLVPDETTDTFQINEPTLKENTGVGARAATINVEVSVEDRTFTLALRNNSGYFDVGNTDCIMENSKSVCKADLLVASVINYEKIKTIDILIEATADNGKQHVHHFDVVITDQNESPTDIKFSVESIEVHENSQNEFIGIFKTIDPDMNDAHVFQLDGTSNLKLHENGSLISAVDAVINFEATNEITIVVTTTDSGGLTFNKTFTINVLDVNEKPNGIQISNNKIPEMTTIGTSVGSLQVDDPDNGQQYSLDIVAGDDEKIFFISDYKLKVAEQGINCSLYGNTYCALNYESKSLYTLTIKVTDDGTPILSNYFNINVSIEDVNDKPGSIQLNSTKVNENTAPDTAIAMVTSVDKDKGQRLTFTLAATDMFYLSDQNVMVKGALDFETASTHTLQIVVTDDGNPVLSSELAVQIEVIDVNERPGKLSFVHTVDSSIAFTDDSPHIEENMPPSTYIGQMVALDPDSPEEIKLQIMSPDLMILNQECIPLAKGTRCTCDVSSTRTFDFEKEIIIQFEVIGTDKNGLQIQKNFVLTIEDSNDAPTDVYFTINNERVKVLTVEENSIGVLVAELSAEDEEAGQAYIYDVVDNTKSFYVTNNELRVTSAAKLDYERQQQISVNIKVTDSGSPPLSFVKQVSIQIIDVNEAPTLAVLTNNEILENATVGETVGGIEIQDPDNMKRELQTFVITVTNDDSPFSIEGHNLVVANSDLNRPVYTIDIGVTDSGMPALTETFQLSVTVLDVNDPPVKLDFTGETITENAEVGTIVGELIGRDDDIGQTLVYNIVDYDDLAINASYVIVNGLINYEVGDIIEFVAKVYDDGNPSLSLETSFTLKIEDVNERPLSVRLIGNDEMGISEGTLAGDTVGTVEVIDEDRSEVYEGNITDGGEIFKLSSSGFVCEPFTNAEYKITVTRCTIDLLLNTPVDYEAMTEPISVTVSARDKGGLERKQMFTFTVTNVNEPPKDILLDTELASIPENSDNVIVGGLSAIDDDKSDTHVFQVITHWELFTVIGNKLYLRTALDYETQNIYVVSIKTTDSGTPKMSFTKEFFLNVSNENEAPSLIELSHDEVEVGAEQGTVVGHITVVDPDNLGEGDVLQTHECSLVPGELFTVDVENSVVVTATIPVVPAISITITCTDSGTPQLSTSQDFEIHVVENVNAPKGIQLMTGDGNKEITVDENLAEANLGSFSIVNLLSGNTESGMYVYLIENGEDLGLMAAGSILQLTRSMDYETTQFVEFTVDAMGVDSAGAPLSLSQEFKIAVNDVNEAPTDVGVYGDKMVKENTPAGSIIGDLFTIDPEDDQTYIYAILGVNFGFNASRSDTNLLDVFSVDGKSLLVGEEAEAINYETSDIMTILVQSTDSGSIPYSVESFIHLQILDTNDPPTGIELTNNMVAEDGPVDAVMGTIIVVDEDIDQEQRCEILNIIDVPFKITDNTELVVDQELDYESQKNYNVKISCGDTVQDGTRLKLTKTLVVNVTNVNEAPTDVRLSVTEIPEANVVGQIVAEIHVTDMDSPKTFINLMEEDDWESFSIEGDSTLVTNVVFDFEDKPYYNLVINASDDEGAFTKKAFEIQVTDVNEPPSSITLDRLEVLENKQQGDVIGTFTTNDPDRNQKFEYTLNEETRNTGTFQIKDSTLRVGPSGVDYETQHEHVIGVTSTDDGEPTQSVQVNFTITILDTNESPSDVIVTINGTIPEDTPIHTVIAEVQVDDPDANQSHSCQLNDTAHVTLATKDSGMVEMVLLQALDFEASPVLYLNISCTDGEFEIYRTINVNVRDVNEPPTSIQLSGSQTVKVTADPGHVIGQLTVQDDDNGQRHTITVVGRNSDMISVNSNNELTLKTAIPSAQIDQLDPSLQFLLAVADNGDPVMTYNQTFTIPITDIDIVTYEIPTLSIDNRNISENSKSGTVVGKLFFLEQTTLDSLFVSIEENFENVFAIENETNLVFANDFTSTDSSSISIVIKVLDTKTQEFKLNTITLFVQRTCLTNQTVCSENETCVTYNKTTSSCECKPDFERDDSNGRCSAIDNCVIEENGSDVLCQNGGTCVDDVNSFVCKCPTGFAGEFCEIDNNVGNPCNNNDCKHGGVCVPDTDNNTYNCSCTAGWEGDQCQTSKDDCSGDSSCNDRGACIDKYLTYLCDCIAGYKGLRCEYEQDICSERNCNSTHVCVGKAFLKDTICVVEDTHRIDLIYNKPDDVQDIEEFKARLVDFIVKSGRLPTLTAPSTTRRKRTTDVKEAQIYILEAEEIDNDRYKFSFVILDEAGEPFTKDEAISVLYVTCTKINSGDQSETMFCPPIVEAARKPTAPPESSSLPIGIIAGAIGAVVVFVIVICVAAVVCKKKKDNSVRPEGVESAIASRRSSGYSSLTKAGRPKPAPNVGKNQVAPEQAPNHPVDDSPSSSVSELEPVYGV